MFSYNILAAEIHADNVQAGWWNDLVTGAVLDRNIGELLCLCHSEVSEAYEGLAHDLPDDKLPHLPMFKVELADTAIRLYDIAGFYKVDLDGLIPTLPLVAPVDDQRVGLLWLHYALSQAMEGFRKNNQQLAHVSLTRALYLTYALGGAELAGIIQEKRAFNKNRADHKPENRKLANGKKF